MSDHANAVESYKRALSFKASSFDGWMGLGQSSLQLGRWRDAASAFQNALAVQPKSAEAQSGLKSAQGQISD